MDLQKLSQQRINLEANLLIMREHFISWSEKMQKNLVEVNRLISIETSGMDLDKVLLAESVMDFGQYARGGDERQSVVDDAIKQLSTGQPIRQEFSDLWVTYFGTKNYAHWSGQRSDHSYGCGPRHGSTCFSVGLKRDIRKRDPQQLTELEIEACLYYLMNIQKIQEAAKAA